AQIGDADVGMLLVVHEPVLVVIRELTSDGRRGDASGHAVVLLDDGLEAAEDSVLLASFVDADRARTEPELVAARVGCWRRLGVCLRRCGVPVSAHRVL